MFGHLVLGLFLGAAATRFIARRRFHGGGCGFRHRGWHGGFNGFGHGRGRRMFWLIRELGLSGEQVSQLKEVWLSGRGAVASMRANAFQSLHAVWEVASAEPLDRARLEEAARRHGEESTQAARAIADAVARVYEVLTPEQRAKVRAHLGQMAGGGGGGWPGWRGGDGPYRTSI